MKPEMHIEELAHLVYSFLGRDLGPEAKPSAAYQMYIHQHPKPANFYSGEGDGLPETDYNIVRTGYAVLCFKDTPLHEGHMGFPRVISLKLMKEIANVLLLDDEEVFYIQHPTRDFVRGVNMYVLSGRGEIATNRQPFDFGIGFRLDVEWPVNISTGGVPAINVVSR